MTLNEELLQIFYGKYTRSNMFEGNANRVFELVRQDVLKMLEDRDAKIKELKEGDI